MRHTGLVLLCLVFALLGAAEAVGQDARSRLPASSEDLWRRWLELIAGPDVVITPARFESLFGVPLSEQRRSNGTAETTYDAVVDYVAYRYWYLALTLSPDKTTAVLEWSAPFENEEGRDCADADKAKRDLSAIGFQGESGPPRPDPHPIRSSTPPDYKRFQYFRPPAEELRSLTGHGRTLRPPIHDRLFLCQYVFTRTQERGR